MKAVGCNIYAGGLSVGVAKHFEVTNHLEHDNYGRDVIALNQPDVEVHSSTSDWPDKNHWRGKNRAPFVFANPPCAPFSLASHGRKTAWHEDPRLQRSSDVVGLLRTMKPTILASESVVPAWTKGRDYWLRNAQEAADQGYSLTVLLHNAMHVGVPQNRPRVFFVFHKVQLEIAPIIPGEPTVRSAFRGLKIPKWEKERFHCNPPRIAQRVLPYCKPGMVLRRVFDATPKLYRGKTDRGTIKDRPGFMLRRLDWDAPSSVVGGTVLFHPTEDRYFYPSELHRLVTFPDGYKWPEGMAWTTIAAYVSRGVAPKVGEWLAQTAKDSIEADKGIRGKPRVVVHNHSKGQEVVL